MTGALSDVDAGVCKLRPQALEFILEVLLSGTIMTVVESNSKYIKDFECHETAA